MPGMNRVLLSLTTVCFLCAASTSAQTINKADWEKQRPFILQAMEEVMGPLPGKEKRCSLNMKSEEEIDCGSYVRRRITYASEPGSRVPAYLLVPKDALAGKRKCAGMLCLHATEMTLGYKTVVGLGGPYPAYGAELAGRGYVVLCPSYPLMADYEPDLRALGYASGTMKAIWDNQRGIDLLETLPFVKKGQYGAIGHSLGGHNALFTAVFDRRIKAVVSSCGFDSFKDYQGGNIKGWTSPRYMPRLRDYAPGRAPFDFDDVLSALAPRPLFVNAPLRDSNFQWQSVDRIMASVSNTYKIYNAVGNLKLEHPDCPHEFPAAIRQEAYRWLDGTLMPDRGEDELPPDLPLPAAAPSRDDWLRGANLLQPYAHSQYLELVNSGDRPGRLRSELGFNAIVVQPPDSHNAVSEAKWHMTDAQFRDGVDAFRAAGYHIILYSSLTGAGFTTEFASGKLSREHPDWQMRDPKGNPVLVYGAPWLCPSTGALQYTLDYTLGLARDYHPDGILIDNQEFFQAQAGWTCHCAACAKAFRQYLRHRFGNEGAKRLFGAEPDQIEIPSQAGPLFNVWMTWRNRVMAQVNETFRARLRAIDPKIILFGNTQYMFDDGMLGTDMQYEHEDVLVSESCDLGSRRMSKKMVLGNALAEGRPLWNYIGTFTESGNYTGLKPVAVIAPLIAATLAHNARPWIVDGFDEGQTNAEARREMAALLGWHAARPDLFDNVPWTPVGVVFSLQARNIFHSPIFPPHLDALLESGAPVAGLRDDKLTAQTLKPYQVITVETAATLDAPAAAALAKWVRRGGVLIAAADTGSFDELGRKRGESTLWRAFAMDGPPPGETTVGRGKVICPDAGAFAATAVKYASDFSFAGVKGSGIEVTPYRGRHALFLQLVRHEASTKALILGVPSAFSPAIETAQLFTPDSENGQPVALSASGGAWSAKLAGLPVYSVLRIELSGAKP